MNFNVDAEGAETVSESLKKLEKTFNHEMIKTMAKVTKELAEYAQNNHRFISRSGALEKSVVHGVISKSPLVGEVALSQDSPAFPYNYFQHEGTGRYGPRRRKYLIKPRRKELLRWSSKGKFYSAKQVIHPGVKPDPFLYLAAQKKEKEIKSALKGSINKVLKEAELL